MKLSLRILALLILIAFGFSIPAPQPVRADPLLELAPAKYYVGRLNLRIDLSSNTGSIYQTTWQATYTIHIGFNIKGKSGAFLVADGPVSVDDGLYEPESPGCTDFIWIARGFTESNLTVSDQQVNNYDPKEKVFAIPFGLDPNPVWAVLDMQGHCGGEGISSVPCDEDCSDYVWKPDVSFSKLIETMQVYVIQDTGNSLAGTCKLLHWDDLPPSSAYRYETKCSWLARKVPFAAPEWKEKK